MFWYNLKITIRNILKNRGFSIINLIGLSIGMACSLLILLMAYFMISIDRFHENYKNIFLLQQRLVLTSGDYTSDRVGGSMGPSITETYPQVQHYTRIGQLPEMLLSYKPEDNYSIYTESRSFLENDGISVDSTFFDVFSFTLLNGNPETALKNNNFLVLTEELANKIFAEEDPIGKTVFINEGMGLTVTGVLEDIPDNSSIKFSYITPLKVLGELGFPLKGYGGTNFFTYFVLDNKASGEIINEDLNDYLATVSEKDMELETDRFLTHIRSAFLFGEQKQFIGIFVLVIVGLGILIIACLNYINLSTAKSLERAREVGIRKTGGASRFQLMRQFLGESLILSIIAVHFAILLVELALPKIRAMFDADVTIQYSDPAFWVIILGIVLVVGILAGSYPAMLLSSLRPSLILRDFQSTGSKGTNLRKILVVSQFTITIFFILCTIFFYRQVDHLYTADLGFNKENLIYIPSRGELWNKYYEVKSELLKESSVVNVTSASSLPCFADRGEIEWGKEKDVQNTVARIIYTDYDFIETFEMEMAHGRFYSEEHSSDSVNGIIVNEEIVKMLDYEGYPVGQRFRLYDDEYTIVGVIKNFTFFPIDVGGKGLIMPFRQTNDFIFVKLKEDFNTTTISRIQGIFKKHNPDYPFEYYLMSEYKNPVFASTDKLVSTLYYFCAFSIFISCMGLFGLALYTVERRTKEIGIRKAFGASVSKIIALLSSEFIKLVVIANVIALPLAYFTLNATLKYFMPKIKLDISIFIGTALLMILIAFLTVLWQSLSTARKNPVTSLRYE